MSNQKTAAEFQVALRSKKANREEIINFADLPQASQEAIIRYGAMRFINDKLGGMEPKEAQKKFDEVFAQLQKGWIDQRGQGTGATIDPIQKEMEALAWNRIKAALKVRGIPLKALDAEKKKQLITDLVTKHEKELRPQAEQIVAARGVTLDLGELDLGGMKLESQDGDGDQDQEEELE